MLIEATHKLDQIGGYKIGAALGLSLGLRETVRIARDFTSKPLIYDHQKAGTDIPETAKLFAAVLKDSGINAVILFPLSGPLTQVAWIKASLEAGLHVIVGGQMTHRQYLAMDGGYIDDKAPSRIIRSASDQGITDYVLPGNNVEAIRQFRVDLESNGDQPVYYSPGLVTQGGEITAAGEAAGPNWHAIVGRAIYEPDDVSGIQRAAEDVTRQLQ